MWPDRVSNQAEKIYKEVACVQIFVYKIQVSLYLKVEQFNSHTCFGHSNIVFIL